MHDTISTGMKIREVTKPISPQLRRVDQLRSQLDAARRAAKKSTTESIAAANYETKSKTKSIGVMKKPTVRAQWVDVIQLIFN